MSKQAKPSSKEDVRKIVREEIENTRPKWTKEYVTKDYLDEKLDKVDEKLTKFKDDILTAVDGVMGELKDMREEQTIASAKLSEHSDTLENHETRLQKLEKPHLASI